MFLKALLVVFKEITEDKADKHFSLILNSQAQKKKCVQNAKCECSICLSPRFYVPISKNLSIDINTV